VLLEGIEGTSKSKKANGRRRKSTLDEDGHPVKELSDERKYDSFVQEM